MTKPKFSENPAASTHEVAGPGERVLRAEGEAIVRLADRMRNWSAFPQAVEAIYACTGTIVLTGVGKAGIIAQKISATLASTGTMSIFLHPVEALHGDLGRLRREDVLIALSNSGSSEEIVRLLDHVKRLGSTIIALTGQDDSPLGRHADMTLSYGSVEEACPLGLAPTVSTTVMLALGDALSLAVMERRNFKPAEYAAYHPGGALGRQFLRVEEVMTTQPGEPLPVAQDDMPLAEALAAAEIGARRTGAMLLVNADGALTGILTDADIRRLLVGTPDGDLLAKPVREVMTAKPKRVRTGDLVSEAEAILNEFRIDELPVVDADGKPVGIIDVQDVLGVKTIRDA